jgi:hypothetical protein
MSNDNANRQSDGRATMAVSAAGKLGNLGHFHGEPVDLVHPRVGLLRRVHGPERPPHGAVALEP